ncbi:MAG: RecX family transcriptional regulator [Clostridia bacterium]|nr:RecX family transcriptional regulator [Clostridia bacterium]
MEISTSIISCESRRGGTERFLTLKITSGEHSEKRKLAVGAKMLAEAGITDTENLPLSITREQFDTLEYMAELWEAVKKGLDILSFADNTKSRLIKKLRERSFDKYIAEDAAEYLSRYGYIDETGMLERLVDRLANTKLYGRGRIKAEIIKKGISREVVDENLEALLDEVDFEENLKKLLYKKCDIDSLSDRKYRESVYAAMYRYGYSVSQTRDAIKIIEKEN